MHQRALNPPDQDDRHGQLPCTSVGTALNELVLSWWRDVEVRITQPRAKTVETDSRHPVALPLIEPAC